MDSRYSFGKKERSSVMKKEDERAEILKRIEKAFGGDYKSAGIGRGGKIVGYAISIEDWQKVANDVLHNPPPDYTCESCQHHYVCAFYQGVRRLEKEINQGSQQPIRFLIYPGMIAELCSFYELKGKESV